MDNESAAAAAGITTDKKEHTMSVFELILLGVGLAMDAFAVSVCKGLTCKKISLSKPLIAGAYFGGFQALMPLIGFLLGRSVRRYIESVDHWVAFVLLALIGFNMIRESFSKQQEPMESSFGFRAMFPMAIATSIDALAVGISLACLPNTNLWLAITLIGVITFLLSAVGVVIGRFAGAFLKSKAEFCGGLILVLIGLKILLEHLNILRF